MTTTLDGAVSVVRALAAHEIWHTEPFTRGQAWLDLILLANTRAGTIFVRNNPVTIERGQVGWSTHKLAERWQWSRAKVSTFLNFLQAQSMVKLNETNLTTIITIKNYLAYQLKPAADLTAEHAADLTAEPATPPTADDATNLALSRKKEVGNTSARVSEIDGNLPSLGDVLEAAKGYPGDLARGIPALIPEPWATSWYAYMMGRPDRFPHRWLEVMFLKYRADWVAGIHAGPGLVPATKKKGGDWGRVKQLEAELAGMPPGAGAGAAGPELFEKYLKTKRALDEARKELGS